MLTLSTLASLALKTGLLMCAAGLASALLVKASAAHRHLVWVSALALALILPFAMLFVPALPVVPAFWQHPAPLPVPMTGREVLPLTRSYNLWQPILAGVWLLGAAGLLVRDVIAHAALARWSRRAEPLGATRWAATLNGLRCARAPGVYARSSTEIASPCTWGLLQPVLLLPMEGEGWSEAQRRDALLHELEHVRRLDYLSALVARLACALHWYNPLVWFAANRARSLQEEACDDAVLRSGGVPSDYAQLLLDIARQAAGRPVSMEMAMEMAKSSSLRKRVLAILDEGRARLAPGPRTIALTVFPLSGLTLFLASASAITPSPEPKFETEYAALAGPTQPPARPPLVVSAPAEDTAHRLVVASLDEPVTATSPEISSDAPVVAEASESAADESAPAIARAEESAVRLRAEADQAAAEGSDERAQALREAAADVAEAAREAKSDWAEHLAERAREAAEVNAKCPQAAAERAQRAAERAREITEANRERIAELSEAAAERARELTEANRVRIAALSEAGAVRAAERARVVIEANRERIAALSEVATTRAIENAQRIAEVQAARAAQRSRWFHQSYDLSEIPAPPTPPTPPTPPAPPTPPTPPEPPQAPNSLSPLPAPSSAPSEPPMTTEPLPPPQQGS